jgi:putative SOS response-associated peptidase YedK
LFTFGGLYTNYADTETGEIKQTYTIVTTAATGLMAEIHNNGQRMPVMLDQTMEREWLNGAAVQEFAERTIEVIATAC